jgi:hypothetical protein
VLKIDVSSVLSQASSETVSAVYAQAVEVLEQSVLRVGADADTYCVSQLKMVADQLRRTPPVSAICAINDCQAKMFFNGFVAARRHSLVSQQ